MTDAVARDRPMVRTVHVLPIDGIGGVEVAAHSALGQTDGMTLVLAPMAGGAPSDVTGAILPPRYRSADDPRAIVDTVRRVLRYRPEVVVGSLWRSVWVLLLLRLLRPRLRLVYFLHLERSPHVVDRLFSAVGVAVATAIWCDSRATQQGRLSPAQRRRSTVIPFVTERLSPASGGPPRPAFVMWARLHRQKGVDRAIALIAALVERGIDARFEVHGPDGGEHQALAAQVRALGLEQRVRLAGPIAATERAGAAATATFFLQLSRSEGMAMSVVEAMQLGLVPVVTAVGEIGRYVADGVSGVVVDPAALDQAADRLATLLRDPARVAAMRDAATAVWQDATLYRDDFAAAAQALAGRR